jgi:hypothetical protein
MSSFAFVPKISKVEEEFGSAYLSVFTQEKTPLEKLFQGNRLFLSEQAWTSSTQLQMGTGMVASSLKMKKVSQPELKAWLQSLLLRLGFKSISKIELTVFAQRVGIWLEGQFKSFKAPVAIRGSIGVNGQGAIQTIQLDPLRVGFLAPLLEGILLSILVETIKKTIFHESISQPILNLQIVIVLGLSLFIALLHSLVYRETRITSFSQWFFLALAGVGIMMVLPPMPGFLTFLSLHVPWNVLVIQAQKLGFKWAPWLRPGALLGFSIGESAPSQFKEALSVNRSLIFSANANDVDTALYAESLKQGKPYLRLTLKRENDLDQLLTQISLDENSQFNKPAPGSLIDILKSDGVLLIDYNNSDPKIIESFNSLFFEKDPHYQTRFGKISINKNLRIIGILDKKKIPDHSATFFSRSTNCLYERKSYFLISFSYSPFE